MNELDFGRTIDGLTCSWPHKKTRAPPLRKKPSSELAKGTRKNSLSELARQEARGAQGARHTTLLLEAQIERKTLSEEASSRSREGAATSNNIIMGRGALVFKGDEPKKKSKKRKHSNKTDTAPLEAAVKTDHSVLPPVIRPHPASSAAAKEQSVVPEMKEGTGLITTSGTVVTGINTRFDKELDHGDALIVQFDDNQEMRVVTMRLSPFSCAISSSFTENVKVPTSFHVIRKPRNRELEARQKQIQAQREQSEIEQLAFGAYATNKELVYHEKTEHGSYRIQRVQMDSDVTRGDLLHMRTEKKSDKYC